MDESAPYKAWYEAPPGIKPLTGHLGGCNSLLRTGIDEVDEIRRFVPRCILNHQNWCEYILASY